MGEQAVTLTIMLAALFVCLGFVIFFMHKLKLKQDKENRHLEDIFEAIERNSKVDN